MVDSFALSFPGGVEVDYVDDGVNATFVFNNVFRPLAVAAPVEGPVEDVMVGLFKSIPKATSGPSAKSGPALPGPVSPLGTHLIIEFYGCSQIDDSDFVRSEIVQAATASGATVLQVDIHDFGEGFGVTGVALLAESHISIHTWPEFGYAAIDVFVCGHADPQIAVDFLEVSFKAARIEIVKHLRGTMAMPKITNGVR